MAKSLRKACEDASISLTEIAAIIDMVRFEMAGGKPHLESALSGAATYARLRADSIDEIAELDDATLAERAAS